MKILRNSTVENKKLHFWLYEQKKTCSESFSNGIQQNLLVIQYVDSIGTPMSVFSFSWNTWIQITIHSFYRLTLIQLSLSEIEFAIFH